MATVNVTDENFEAEVIKAGKPVIVDFQKSTITGLPALITSASKFSSVTFTVAIAFIYKDWIYIQAQND